MSDLVERLRYRMDRYEAGEGNARLYLGEDAVLDGDVVAELEANHVGYRHKREMQRLKDALEAAQAQASRAQNEMANVIIQADCLRHYAQFTDERKHKFLPTVGEVQAGHFEDIAIRAFPALSALLEEKRQARALEKEARNG